MADTMVERMAKAASPNAFNGRYSTKNAQTAEKRRALATAYDVLAAMREPTVAMTTAWEAFAMDLTTGRAAWCAMIDAALVEVQTEDAPIGDAITPGN